jgi:hypothetical protein
MDLNKFHHAYDRAPSLRLATGSVKMYKISRSPIGELGRLLLPINFEILRSFRRCTHLGWRGCWSTQVNPAKIGQVKEETGVFHTTDVVCLRFSEPLQKELSRLLRP